MLCGHDAFMRWQHMGPIQDGKNRLAAAAAIKGIRGYWPDELGPIVVAVIEHLITAISQPSVVSYTGRGFRHDSMNHAYRRAMAWLIQRYPQMTPEGKGAMDVFQMWIYRTDPIFFNDRYPSTKW